MVWNYQRENSSTQPIDWRAINELIKADVTIEKALNAYLPGVKIGRHKRIPCPLHLGDGPNFSFGDTYYKCFVCGESGDVIKLTCALLKCEYLEAVNRLNEDFNLRLPLNTQQTFEERLQSKIRAREIMQRVEEENARRAAEKAEYDHLIGAWVAGDIFSRSDNPEERAEGIAVMTIYGYLLNGLGDTSE